MISTANLRCFRDAIPTGQRVLLATKTKIAYARLYLRQDCVMGDEKISPSEGQSCESEVTSGEANGVSRPEEEHAVDMAGEGKVPGVKSKKNLLKKIFMPWKWKAKRKSDKFKQRCTILERKISVECAKHLLII